MQDGGIQVPNVHISKPAKERLSAAAESLGLTMSRAATNACYLYHNAVVGFSGERADVGRPNLSPTPDTSRKQAIEIERAWQQYNSLMTLRATCSVIERSPAAMNRYIKMGWFDHIPVYRSIRYGAYLFSPEDVQEIAKTLREHRILNDDEYGRLLLKVNQLFYIRAAWQNVARLTKRWK